MENTTKLYLVMSDEEQKEHLFTVPGKEKEAFYDYVARRILGDPSNYEHLDCRHITIASDIMDTWFENTDKMNLTKEQFGMLLLQVGPKEDKLLPHGTICIEEGIFSGVKTPCMWTKLDPSALKKD